MTDKKALDVLEQIISECSSSQEICAINVRSLIFGLLKKDYPETVEKIKELGLF